MKLGEYCSKGQRGLTVAQARKLADEARLRVVAGVDPQSERVEQRQSRLKAFEEQRRALSVSALVDRFEVHKRGIKETTRRDYLARLRRHVVPKLGDMPAKDVASMDVRRLLGDLAAAGKATEANHVRACMQSLFSWAEQTGQLDSNPTAGVKKLVRERPRTRVLDDQEVRTLWTSLPCWERGGNGERPFAPITPLMASFFRLLLLTGQRSGDIRQARWEDLDLNSGLWVFPEQRTKNGQRQVFRVSGWALDELRHMRARRVAPCLFPHRSSEGVPMAETSPNGALRNWVTRGRWPFQSPWTPHDLRRTVRTGLASLGVAEWIAERALNHKKQGMIAVYDRHDYVDEISEALRLWGDKVRHVVQGAAEASAIHD